MWRRLQVGGKLPTVSNSVHCTIIKYLPKHPPEIPTQTTHLMQMPTLTHPIYQLKQGLVHALERTEPRHTTPVIPNVLLQTPRQLGHQHGSGIHLGVANSAASAESSSMAPLSSAVHLISVALIMCRPGFGVHVDMYSAVGAETSCPPAAVSTAHLQICCVVDVCTFR